MRHLDRRFGIIECQPYDGRFKPWRAARGEAVADIWRHVRWTRFAATLGDGQAADAWMRRAKLNAYRTLPPLPLP